MLVLLAGGFCWLRVAATGVACLSCIASRAGCLFSGSFLLVVSFCLALIGEDLALCFVNGLGRSLVSCFAHLREGTLSKVLTAPAEGMLSKALAGPALEVAMPPMSVESTVKPNKPAEGEGIQPPNCPHLQGRLNPCSSLVFSNPETPFPFETSSSSGFVLPLHRPTYDKVLDKSGKYPYADVFAGRHVHWEMRIQIRFKEQPKGPLMFGIELDEYVPLFQSTKYMMKKVVGVLKWAIGDDLYHSVGDDPKKTVGEAEKPAFAMPLWAFDQIIVTPDGEAPPPLSDPELRKLGICRESGDAAAFAKAASAIELQAGPTYTLCFWSIASLLDVIQWQMTAIPGVRIGFDQFCRAPPVRLVLYTLKPSGDQHDERHTQSRKTYFFELSFWSSLQPPPPKRLEQLVSGGRSRASGGQHDAVSPEPSQASPGKAPPEPDMCCADRALKATHMAQPTLLGRLGLAARVASCS